jgi:uncharacterized membrane protein YhaH (DUF805 family)
MGEVTLTAIHDRLWALYEWAVARGRLRWIFVGFLLATSLFYFRNEYLKDASQGRFVPFDGWIYYSAENFETQVETLSPSGRRVYIATQLSLDVIYPVIYLQLFGGWLALFSRPLRATHAFLNHAALLPLLAVAADLIENVTVSYLIWQFDRFQAVGFLVPVAALATSIKWAALLVLTVVIGLGFITGRRKKDDDLK